MQTEPEQWAVELWTEARRRHEMAKRSLEFSNRELEGIAALLIQRAFEERERKLREAATALVAALESDKHYFGDEYNALRQALKETPDAQ